MDVWQILTSLFTSFVNFIPNLLGCLVLVLIGWIVGSIVGKITREILRKLRIDQRIAGKRRIPFRVSEIFGILFEWVIYIVFLQAAVEVLGIKALIDFFKSLLAFLPKLIEAIILVIAGYAIGAYVRDQIIKSKVMYADIISSFLFFLIVYISVALALPLIGIDPFLVNAILIILLGSLGAGFAIAIGLGLKDAVSQMAKRYLLKKVKRKR